MSNLYVYGLYDPKDKALRYIGKTWNIRTRRSLHKQQAKKALDHPCICTPVELWLGELFKASLEPVFEILLIKEHTRYGHHDYLEADLIERLCEVHNLLNKRYNYRTQTKGKP